MIPWFILALCFVLPACADTNGMDMSMDTSMDLAVGNMLPYLHFTPGDTVWFLGWVPSSAGAMAGTCIALFLLSVLERWLAACIGLAEWYWAERTSVLMLEKPLPDNGSSHLASSIPTLSYISKKLEQSGLTRFIPEFDVARGILFGAHAFVKISLMMAVMTFQLGFIASAVVGSGVGETLFGRFSSLYHEH